MKPKKVHVILIIVIFHIKFISFQTNFRSQFSKALLGVFRSTVNPNIPIQLLYIVYIIITCIRSPP